MTLLHHLSLYLACPTALTARKRSVQFLKLLQPNRVPGSRATWQQYWEGNRHFSFSLFISLAGLRLRVATVLPGQPASLTADYSCLPLQPTSSFILFCTSIKYFVITNPELHIHGLLWTRNATVQHAWPPMPRGNIWSAKATCKPPAVGFTYTHSPLLLLRSWPQSVCLMFSMHKIRQLQ